MVRVASGWRTRPGRLVASTLTGAVGPNVAPAPPAPVIGVRLIFPSTPFGVATTDPCEDVGFRLTTPCRYSPMAWLVWVSEVRADAFGVFCNRSALGIEV